MARAAYNALTDAEKARVDNYAVLTAAEARCIKLTGSVGPSVIPIDPDAPICEWYGQSHTGVLGKLMTFVHRVFLYITERFGLR